jgi:hypothetical protein
MRTATSYTDCSLKSSAANVMRKWDDAAKTVRKVSPLWIGIKSPDYACQVSLFQNHLCQIDVSYKDLLTRKIRQSCFAQFSFFRFVPSSFFLTTTSQFYTVEALLTLNFRPLSYPSLFKAMRQNRDRPHSVWYQRVFRTPSTLLPYQNEGRFLALFSKLAHRGRLTKQHLGCKGLRAYSIRIHSSGNIPVFDNKRSEKNMEA